MFRYCVSLKWWSIRWCTLEKGRKSHAKTACKYLREQTGNHHSELRSTWLLNSMKQQIKHVPEEQEIKKLAIKKTQAGCLKVLEILSKILRNILPLSHSSLPPPQAFKSYNMVELIGGFFAFFSQQSESSISKLSPFYQKCSLSGKLSWYFLLAALHNLFAF